MLTFIYTYRERDAFDLQRWVNSLESLKKQNQKIFEVICVDYGNLPLRAKQLEEIVAAYPFCRILRTETQGYLWNRSHALNTAIRNVSTPYLATTDIDAIFSPDFTAVLSPCLKEDSYLVCGAHELSEDFHIERIEFLNVCDLPEPKKNCGIFQAISTKQIQDIGGFDEYYRGWGKEDRDLDYRLQKLGFKKQNLWGKAFVFHQYHSKNNQPEFSFVEENFSQKKMDGTLWKNMCGHYLKNANSIQRNDAFWGKRFLHQDRTSFKWIDREGEVKKDADFKLFTLTTDGARDVNRFVYFFLETLPGEATLIRYQKENAFFESFLFQVISDAQEVVEDYYFNLQSQDRFVLLVRK